MKKINIANDFSPYPGGRYIASGDFSGELFRRDFLIPILEANETAEIDFDGTRGYGTSFLEEAFGGLVRLGYSQEIILNTFTFKSSSQGILDSVLGYIAKEDLKRRRAG